VSCRWERDGEDSLGLAFGVLGVGGIGLIVPTNFKLWKTFLRHYHVYHHCSQDDCAAERALSSLTPHTQS
jgi:hypothetical protein